MKIKWWILCLATWIGAAQALAQDTGSKKLAVNVDAKLFFVDNEFDVLMKGYTLPGFRLTPTLSYEPNSHIRLEGGAYMLHYWGANSYPNSSYLFIPEYSATGNTKALHVLPFLRLQGSTGFGLTVVAGNIYGQERHRLLPQLYAPELALSADPEAGLQLLFSRKWIDLDAWVDWRQFIFHKSPYRENFFVGASLLFRYNQARRGLEAYSPLQMLLEHRGGEIDDNATPGVNTLINAAAGAGVRYNTGQKGFQSVALEVDGLLSYQESGKAWPYAKGWSCYSHVDAKGWGFEATVGFYHAHQYISVLGLPLWGVVSTAREGLLLKDPDTMHMGLKYSYEFAPGYALTADAQWYRLLGCDKMESGSPGRQEAASNFMFGVTFTATPSWKF